MRALQLLVPNSSKSYSKPVEANYQTRRSLLTTASPKLYLAKYKLGEAKYKLYLAK